MTRHSILVCSALLFVDCGVQNTSFLSQTFKAETVAFSDLKQSSVLFEGLERDNTIGMAEGPGVDSLWGLSIDSLNQLYFKEFHYQLSRRFPKMRIVSSPSSDSAAFQLSMNRLFLSQQNEPNFWVSPYGVDKVSLTLDVEMRDRRSGSILFRLESNADIMMRSYSNPLAIAIKTTVTRVADYVDSDGKEYRHLESKQ